MPHVPGRRCPFSALLAACLCLSAGDLYAQEDESQPAEAKSPPVGRPLHRLDSTLLLAGRVNPLGLALRGSFSFQRRLYASGAPAFANNYIGIGINPTLSPAGARLGAFVEFQPLSVLQLTANYEWLGYLGTFDVFQSFAGVTSEYSDDTLDILAARPDGDPGRNYSTSGHEVSLSVLLQAKVGPFAVRNRTRFGWVDMDMREGDRTYWDVSYDLLIGDQGWYMVNEADVFWVSDFGLVAGLRWVASHAFYEDRHYAPGETIGDNPNTPTHRLGPTFAYTFFDNGGRGFFDKPTAFVIVNWWLEHRYRTGAEQSVGLPYMGAGFRFTGDLLTL